jgi:hypothetical protein
MAYREKRINPRAENILRHVNDAILYNLREAVGGAVLMLPPRVSRAFMVVNETGTITVRDFNVDVEFMEKQ